MPAVTVTIGGRDRIVDDVEQLRAEMALEVDELRRLYASFDRARAERLLASEPRIRELNNRLMDYLTAIATYEDAVDAIGNILAAHDLLRLLDEGDER